MSLAYLATLPFFGHALLQGQFPVRSGWDYYGHFLMPLLIFCIFMGSQFSTWSPKWSRAAKYTFGVYLVHPLIIDLFDIAVIKTGLAGMMTPSVLVISRFIVVLPAALALSMLLERIRLTAWTIGLGPTPWARNRAPGTANG